MTKQTEPLPEQDPISGIARRIVKLGLATPAILFIDSLKPLGFVAGQFLRVVGPAASLFTRPGTVDALADTLEERSGADTLVREIERLTAEEEHGA